MIPRGPIIRIVRAAPDTGSLSMLRFVSLCLLASLLAGCGAMRLSYDHADWLAARMADRYVDLTDDQARVFKTGLSDLHAWHRARELPVYAQTFDEAAQRLARGMSRADVQWAVDTVRARVHLLGQHTATQVSDALASLDEGQLREVEARFKEDNRKFAREQFSGDPARVAARRADWLCERLEYWTGDLTAAQRGRVHALVDAFPAMPRLRLEERERRQQNLLALVREGRSRADFESRLERFLADPDAGRSEASRRAMLEWERGLIDMLTDLDRTLSPVQRARAVQRMRDYARDFRQLAARRGASVAEAAAHER